MSSEPISSLIINAPPKGLFLDVGCGECEYTNVLRSESRKIISLDMQKPQVPLINDNIFTLGSVESLPFKENSFDFIFCLSVIQFIKDDRAAIEEIFRILKPGGILYLTIPTRNSPFRIIRDLEIRFGTYKYPQFNVKHHHYYARKDIETLIQDLFKVETISGYGFNFIPRLFYLLLDLSKMKKNVAKLYHRFFCPKASNESSHDPKNFTLISEGTSQEKKKNFEHFHSLLWLIYGLAYHYIIMLRKE